jgi:hypothetical protein
MVRHQVREGGISGDNGGRPGAAGGQVVHVRGHEHAATRTEFSFDGSEDARLRRAAAGQSYGLCGEALVGCHNACAARPYQRREDPPIWTAMLSRLDRPMIVQICVICTVTRPAGLCERGS